MNTTTKKVKTTTTKTAKTSAAKPAALKTEVIKAAAPAVEVKPAAVAPVKAATIQPVPAPQPRAKRVCLEIVRPGATRVFVAGDFNGWVPEKTPLTHTGNGKWVGELPGLTGRHEYLFVVDGQWLLDPNAKETVQNPYGGRNSVLSVSE